MPRGTTPLAAGLSARRPLGSRSTRLGVRSSLGL